MMKFLFGGAFALGAIAVIWIGRIFLGADNLGLGVTVLIGAVYAVGAWELLQFRQATTTLKHALGSLHEPLEDLNSWLATLDPSLRNSVRLRIEGERNGLPAPVLTPYLVGLLVMLGLLGTFVGMVDTLKGAVVALEGSSELEAIRAGLAAPIEGLGLAFGTSVAGVAASAMLGLLSTLSRRERLQTSHLLDAKIAVELRNFSSIYQRTLAYQAVQQQTQALPDVVTQLSELANNIEQMSTRVNQALLDSQVQFQGTVTTLYSELNTRLDESLRTGLLASGQAISASIQPMAENTLAKLNEISAETHKHLNSLSEQQFRAMNQGLESNVKIVAESVDAVLVQQNNSSAALLKSIQEATAKASDDLHSRSSLLLESFASNSEQWAKQQQEQAAQFSATIREELADLREQEHTRGDAAVARLQQLEGSVASHLSQLGSALEAPMTRLIETASQTPKAAAEVIETLRGKMTQSLERDNDLLTERTRLMAQLDSLSVSLSDASNDQRRAIDSLIERSAATLEEVGSQFGEQMQSESSKLSGVVEHFASSSAEMASLGDSFNTAVTLFSDSNNQLIENLTRIEASLEQSNSRSDEQLAYYVAQAREIIDHNLLSHQQIIAALHAQKPTQLTVTEVAS